MTIHIYSFGLVACSVCAPKDMPMDVLTREVNSANPTGIESQWALSEDKTFRGGEPMPCACNLDSGRMHYLFSC